MSIDPRMLQMSIDGRALQSLQLAAQSIDASYEAEPTCSTRADDVAADREDAPKLCTKPPEAEVTPPLALQQPTFIPASLLEDIAPLEPESSASCSASADGSDRCERHPPLPQRLSLDIFAAGALLRPLMVVSHPPARKATLGLAPIVSRLLGPSEGFPRGPDQPPRA